MCLPPGEEENEPVQRRERGQDLEQLQSLLRPYLTEAMVAYLVSTRVNNPANDSHE